MKIPLDIHCPRKYNNDNWESGLFVSLLTHPAISAVASKEREEEGRERNAYWALYPLGFFSQKSIIFW